jgi:chemotaxis protein methyltransferase CheR
MAEAPPPMGGAPLARPRVEMTREEFRIIRDIVHEYCGIFFQDDVTYLLERRLQPRLEELGLPSFTEYHRHLRYHAKRRVELEEIIELLTTNETYFFREEYQLRAFSEEILPELLDRRRAERRLRLWSAGCSTGEEAYSIAMLVREEPRAAGWDVEIFGNDISRRVLQVARRGIYSRSSFRRLEPFYQRRYFQPVGDRFQVDAALRAMVSFGQLNLLDGEMLQLVGLVDAIFCRNVLIYFDKPARLKVLRSFYDKLQPRGYLLLGHSESLIHVSTDFELVHLKNDMVYRRPDSVHGNGGQS